MTSYYIQVIETNAALQEAERRSIDARNLAFAVQGMVVRSSTEMGTLVDTINASPLNDATVQRLLQESMNKFTRAEQMKMTAEQAQ